MRKLLARYSLLLVLVLALLVLGVWVTQGRMIGYALLDSAQLTVSKHLAASEISEDSREPIQNGGETPQQDANQNRKAESGQNVNLTGEDEPELVAKKKAHWASVRNGSHYRDIVIVGDAPSLQALRELQNAISAIAGVRKVSHVGKVNQKERERTRFEFERVIENLENSEKTKQTIYLSGRVSHALSTQLAALVTAEPLPKFTDAHSSENQTRSAVINKLFLDPNVDEHLPSLKLLQYAWETPRIKSLQYDQRRCQVELIASARQKPLKDTPTEFAADSLISEDDFRLKVKLAIERIVGSAVVVQIAGK